MELSTVLTYLALLITAYGATQEYVRLKLKLAPLKYKLTFIVTLLLLYLSTLKFIQYELSIYGVIHFPSGFLWYLWESKYIIILTINLFALFMIIHASKLTPRNQKQFLELIHELRAYKNYALLHKLIKENLEIIFKLKYNKTFAEKSSLSGYGHGFDKLYKKLGILDTISQQNNNIFAKLWVNIKLFIYSKLAKFSYKKDIINEIFQYTISDKQIIQSIVEQNEFLGITILKQIVKEKAYNSKFQNRFLIDIFKDTNSYIYKEFILGGSSSLVDFLNENQQFEQGLDIGLNISFSILELLEDNTKILVLNYEQNQLNSLIKQINELLYALSKTDPEKSHYSNLIYYIEKTILEHIDLTQGEKTVGFYFLNQLFNTIKELSIKSTNPDYPITLFNSLYSVFISKASIQQTESNNLIRIGCYYIDYIFNDHYIKDIDLHVKQFRKFISRYHLGYKYELCEMFLLVLDTRRGRGECEDWIAYTHSGINSKISEEWDLLTSFLIEEKDK